MNAPHMNVEHRREVLMSAGVACSQPAEHLTGAGALDPHIPVSRLTSTGAGQAVTLPDAWPFLTGFRKLIVHAVDGGSIVLTPDHLDDGLTTITFANAQDWVELDWSGTAWQVVGYSGVTFA
jgi:hypothetical protein